jgi:hypothetical protein
MVRGLRLIWRAWSLFYIPDKTKWRFDGASSRYAIRESSARSAQTGQHRTSLSLRSKPIVYLRNIPWRSGAEHAAGQYMPSRPMIQWSSEHSGDGSGFLFQQEHARDIIPPPDVRSCDFARRLWASSTSRWRRVLSLRPQSCRRAAGAITSELRYQLKSPT